MSSKGGVWQRGWVAWVAEPRLLPFRCTPPIRDFPILKQTHFLIFSSFRLKDESRLSSLRAMPSKYDPVAAAKKYREIIRPRKGHLPGGQGPRQLLDANERGSLLILKRIDDHIAKVDDARIRHRLRYRKPFRKTMRIAAFDAPLYSIQESAALAFPRSLRRARHRCHTCGNNRLKNPDFEGRCRVCRLRHKAKFKKRHRSTDKAKSARRAARSRRRARLRNAPINDLTAKDEAWVLHLYGTKCLKCGAQPVALDHIVPLACGGPHTASNLQPLCWVCNSSKCARSSADYRPFPYRES